MGSEMPRESGFVYKNFENLFSVSPKYDLLLYDITSTYFEGKMEENPQARRGHSRDHRPDCKQVCKGLIVTRDGMPLGYEVFPGNLHDSKTVKTTVETIEARYGKADRVWVMDRGMISDEILAWMREGGRRYLVGMPKSELKKHAAELRDTKGWKSVRGGVAVRYAHVVPCDDNSVATCCFCAIVMIVARKNRRCRSCSRSE